MPRWVIASPPVVVMVPPSVAVLMPTPDLVGVVSVGAVAALGTKSSPLSVLVPVAVYNVTLFAVLTLMVVL